ncbi:hypothetical protein J6590_067047 [Homalodisca vitripennis]|nr:hypothetical protein J6590_067047 [Homalodisca vitripennis]
MVILLGPYTCLPWTGSLLQSLESPSKTRWRPKINIEHFSSLLWTSPRTWNNLPPLSPELTSISNRDWCGLLHNILNHHLQTSVSDRSTRERLVCECAHLSMFAAQLAVPYIREDTLQVLVLEPVQAGKILPVLILLSQLALYLVGCVFAWLVDRRDKAKAINISLGPHTKFAQCVLKN